MMNLNTINKGSNSTDRKPTHNAWGLLNMFISNNDVGLKEELFSSDL